MEEPHIVEVPEGRLKDLEQDHNFIEMIREKTKRIRYAESEVMRAQKEHSEAKKKLANLNDDLVSVIEDGPPKPDPQAKLPFAQEESEDESEGTGTEDEPQATDVEGESGSKESEQDPATSEDDKEITAEIDSLDLAPRPKQVLANTGVKTIADVIDLVNGNRKGYPSGLKGLTPFGPKSIAKLVDQLPSTVPDEDKAKGAPSEVKRICLLSFIGDSGDFSPGDEYDARILDNGDAVISLPEKEPITLNQAEYELAESS